MDVSSTKWTLTLTCRRLLVLVKCMPGIHLREAQRRGGLGLGATVYNLGKLTSLGLVEVDREGKYLRYYSPGLTGVDRKIFSALHIPSQRKILQALLQSPNASLPDLASWLHLSKSTVKWHLRKLETAGVLRVGSNAAVYQLVDPLRVTSAISRFKLTGSDELSERFLDSWDLV